MDCVRCTPKHCRTTSSCGAEKFDSNELISQYGEHESQRIVQAAAELVDAGRAGTLSRLQELIEFSGKMRYRKVGLAYCYGMEREARFVKEAFLRGGVPMISVSCTVGGLSQNALNRESEIPNVSCNPIGQAKQLEAEGADFVVLMGICLGHDILLQRNLNVDFTTLVVKDRVFAHDPIRGIV